MSRRVVLPALGATAVISAGALLATSAMAGSLAVANPKAYSSHIVSGQLSTEQMQQALNLALLDSYSKQQAAAAAQTVAQSEAAPVAGGSYNAGGDVASWANSAKSNSVKQCESGGNYSINTGNGYYGAWQFDLPSWLANGGGAYAPRPDLAPAWAQDQVAYNYYQKAGWGPWGCG
jgi:resuscitation-promoting factor RpfB